MAYTTIEYGVDAGVATITLNRPEALNALSHELVQELHAALDGAENDSAVRVIILTGSGRAFSSGYDIAGSGDGPDPTDPTGQAATDYIAFWQRTNRSEIDNLTHIWRLRKPVIAAVNGYAMGGGFWYSLACDITIASDRAVFGQPEVRQVSSTTYLFAAIAGWKVANRYTLTGDHFDAAEALRIGVVNEVVAHDQLMTRVTELGRRIARVPEASVRLNKAVTMLGLEVAGLTNALHLNAALNATVHSSHGPDTERLAEAQRTGGFKAFLEQRDGPFRPEPFGPKSKWTRLAELRAHMDTTEFVSGLPKAELHIHIEGTIEPEMAFALAERNQVALPYSSPADLRAEYDFTDLQSFLDVYYSVTAALVTEADFAEIAEAYLVRAAADGVRHAEMFFDPQAHTARGVPIRTVIDGLHHASRHSFAKHGLTSSLIMCFLRHESAASAMETLQSALPHVGKFIGVGLDSSELGHPPAKFEKVFEAARQAGLHVVAHAGEEGPPEYVWEAIRALKVERIDHGVRAVEDPALVRYLAEHHLPLTVCPLSNVRLKVYQSLSEHRLPELLGAGVRVSVNSDDPAFFGGYIAQNFEAVRRQLDINDRQLGELAVSSFNSSFLSEGARQAHVASVHEYLATSARS